MNICSSLELETFTLTLREHVWSNRVTPVGVPKVFPTMIFSPPLSFINPPSRWLHDQLIFSYCMIFFYCWCDLLLLLFPLIWIPECPEFEITGRNSTHILAAPWRSMLNTWQPGGMVRSNIIQEVEMMQTTLGATIGMVISKAHEPHQTFPLCA